MENQLDKILNNTLEQGYTDRVFSAAAVAVGLYRKNKWINVFSTQGVTRFDEQGLPVHFSTLFDLASLTKPLVTVLCALHCIDQKKIGWQEPLGVSYPPDKAPVTFAQLLQHCSGLPGYQPYYQNFVPVQAPENKNELMQCILREPLQYPTETTSLYSDLGFILLGNEIEKRTETPLDQLFKEQIAGPLGLDKELLFLPIGVQEKRDTKNIAATEDCPWRGKILQGEVHDEHSWLMGGVAGHAGLFGTAKAVLQVGELLLDLWKGRVSFPAFDASLLQYALTFHMKGSTWALGFDRPTPGASSSGHYFSPASVGHLGFSGTSLWMDPEKEVMVVLLTNRIHPTRENLAIRHFRPYFHDQVMDFIIKSGK